MRCCLGCRAGVTDGRLHQRSTSRRGVHQLHKVFLFQPLPKGVKNPIVGRQVPLFAGQPLDDCGPLHLYSDGRMSLFPEPPAIE